MIGGEIGQHRHVRREAGRQIDLIGGNLQHIDRPGRGRSQIERGPADIAADLGGVAAGGQDMADQRGRRRFAVGAGHRNHGRAVRLTCGATDFAHEDFEIADDLDAGLARGNHHRMRLGVGERNAGAQDQRGEPRPRPFGEGKDSSARTGGLIAAGGIVVPGHDARACRSQRAHGRDAGTRQSEDGDVLSRECAGRDHVRFTSASTSTARRAPEPPR